MTWKLKHTLGRKNATFRPIETEDLKYLWAAYKKGNLASLGEPFVETGMSPSAFSAEFMAQLDTTYHGAWSLFSDGQFAGAILAFWSHPDPRYAPFMIFGDMLWMPGVSSRKKIEAVARFLTDTRKEISFVEYAEMADKKFFETMGKLGLMRRVGTMNNVYPDRPAAVFETRK